MGTPAKCLPSATALGATWDTELIEQAGFKLLAGEAKLRAAPVILAPTCNIQRVSSSQIIFLAVTHVHYQPESPWRTGRLTRQFAIAYMLTNTSLSKVFRKTPYFLGSLPLPT